MTQPAFGDPIVLRHRDITTEATDELGVLIPEYTDIPYPNVPIWQIDANGIAGNEILGGRDTVIYGLSALMPTDSPVSAYDQIVARGVTYEVDGRPNYLKHFYTGWQPGIMITLRRVEG